MSSGVAVDDECLDAFKDLQKKKLHRYILFKFSPDKRSIIVDYRSGKDETHDDFVQKLLDAGNHSEGRYGMFDCNYQQAKSDKIVLVMWLPDNQLHAKEKMLYTSSKRIFREKFHGIATELQCNDLDDLAWSTMVEKVQSKYD